MIRILHTTPRSGSPSTLQSLHPLRDNSCSQGRPVPPLHPGRAVGSDPLWLVPQPLSGLHDGPLFYLYYSFHTRENQPPSLPPSEAESKERTSVDAERGEVRAWEGSREWGMAEVAWESGEKAAEGIKRSGQEHSLWRKITWVQIPHLPLTVSVRPLLNNFACQNICKVPVLCALYLLL